MIMIKLNTMMNYLIKNFKNLIKLRTCYFETDLKPDNTDIWLFFSISKRQYKLNIVFETKDFNMCF